MRLSFLARLSLAVLVAGPAAAQTKGPRLQAPIPLDQQFGPATLPGPRSEGDRVIAAAKAGDLFENVTSNQGLAAVRHRTSGLVCLFFPGAAANGLTVGTTNGLPRGDEIGCATNSGGVNIWTDAVRYPQPMTLDARLALELKDVTKGLNGAIVPETAPAKPWRTAAVKGVAGGSPEYARIDITQVGPWTVSIMVIGPLSAKDTIDSTAQVNMESNLTAMAKAAGLAPAKAAAAAKPAGKVPAKAPLKAKTAKPK